MIGTLAQQATASGSTLTTHQQVMAIGVAVTMLVVVVELVRRRKLREEYSVLWIGTGVILLALALQPRLLSWFAGAIGAKLPTSALFFGALVFLMAVSLLVSLRLSRLAFRSKALARQVTLLQDEVAELRAALRGQRVPGDEHEAARRRGESTRDGAA